MESLKLEKLKKRDFYSNNDNFIKYKHIKSNLIYGDNNKDAKFITFIMPTYKRGELLKESIFSILNQENFDDYELLIVDNEPIFDKITETEEIIKSFDSEKIVYYRNEENIGAFGNWNRCIELSRSKWICMVHDDDAIVKNHLSTISEILEKNSDISFLSCSHKSIDHRENTNLNTRDFIEKVDIKCKTIKKMNSKDYNFGFTGLLLGAVLEREKAIAIGGFAVGESLIEDYFFVAKFADKYNVYLINEPLYIYRWGENDSLKNKQMWEEQLIYEYYLYLFISNKRKCIVRYLYKHLSKYFILKRMYAYNDGSSFLKSKCDINEENIINQLEFKDSNTNKYIIFIAKTYKRVEDKFRSIINNVGIE